jgi:ABC-type Fe3+/spermidine/putrescine transport system ATPase subunit
VYAQEQTATVEINATPALSISGVHLNYGGVAALGGVDLDVARGEFVALLGPSGCGKTSLLRTVAGFVQPQLGAVRLHGREVSGLPPRKRNIGIVFQSYALFPHMSVLDNVLFGLECRKIGKAEAAERARRTLDLVGLAAMADRRPKQLSGGQQQRVALARAIVIEPDLLLLDEPLGALDKQLRVQMQTELKSLQRRLGVTAVFVTHDQEEAMSMADRIVVMRDGKVVQVDTPERLFGAPNSAWVCEFVGGGNLLRGELVPCGDGWLRLDVGSGSSLRVAQGTPGNVVQVPFDKVRLIPSASDTGLPVTGRRFLGSMVELHLQSAAGTVLAHVPPNEAAAFPLGARAHISADPADCRVLPDR